LLVVVFEAAVVELHVVDDFCSIGELESLAVIVVVAVGRIGSVVEIFVPLFATVAIIVSDAFFVVFDAEVFVLMDVVVAVVFVFIIGTIGTTLDFVVVDVDEIFFVDVNDGLSITEGDFLEPVIEECDPEIIFEDDDSATISFLFLFVIPSIDDDVVVVVDMNVGVVVILSTRLSFSNCFAGTTRCSCFCVVIGIDVL
jgi:hypothetical protein